MAEDLIALSGLRKLLHDAGLEVVGFNPMPSPHARVLPLPRVEPIALLEPVAYTPRPTISPGEVPEVPVAPAGLARLMTDALPETRAAAARLAALRGRR